MTPTNMGYANGSKDTLLGKNQTDDHHHVNGTYEPLAVIGLSLKFPQDATTPDAFFQMLLDKRCVMSEWPSDRLNIDAFYKPSDISVDTVSTRVSRIDSQSLRMITTDTRPWRSFPEGAHR